MLYAHSAELIFKVNVDLWKFALCLKWWTDYSSFNIVLLQYNIHILSCIPSLITGYCAKERKKSRKRGTAGIRAEEVGQKWTILTYSYLYSELKLRVELSHRGTFWTVYWTNECTYVEEEEDPQKVEEEPAKCLGGVCNNFGMAWDSFLWMFMPNAQTHEWWKKRNICLGYVMVFLLVCLLHDVVTNLTGTVRHINGLLHLRPHKVLCQHLFYVYKCLHNPGTQINADKELSWGLKWRCNPYMKHYSLDISSGLVSGSRVLKFYLWLWTRCSIEEINADAHVGPSYCNIPIELQAE